MIALPPGCTINHPITIEIDKLTEEMVDWYRFIGGLVEKEERYDHRGRKELRYRVQYNKGKYCHYRADGTNGVRLHFHGDDAAVASIFVIKFFEHIQQTNLDKHMDIKDTV